DLVTGVQTCALPIFKWNMSSASRCLSLRTTIIGRSPTDPSPSESFGDWTRRSQTDFLSPDSVITFWWRCGDDESDRRHLCLQRGASHRGLPSVPAPPAYPARLRID